MPEITVIMPSYNVGKYIAQCMESVCRQTMQDLEILAIDAGSTDGTLCILRQYEQTDKRVRVVMSEKKSYGYQVNMGIRMAQGKYIAIVETDDYISEDMYASLYQLAEEENADYAKGGFASFWELDHVGQYEIPYSVVETGAKKIINPENTPLLFLRDYYLWTGIYRNDFLKKVVMNESLGAAFQDVGFLYQTMTKAKKAVYIGKTLYYYRQDNGSASSVNRNGLDYIIGEYDFLKKYAYGLGGKWLSVYYVRMLQQTVERFRRMAMAGEFWRDKYSVMEEIKNRLEYALEHEFIEENNMDEYNRRYLRLFLKDFVLLYQLFYQHYQEKRERLCRQLEPLQGEKCVIFGCGQYGKLAHALLKKNEIGDVCAFCDNDPKLQGKFMQNLQILQPMEAVKKYPNAKYLIPSKKYLHEIKEQLLTFGVDVSNVCSVEFENDMICLQQI